MSGALAGAAVVAVVGAALAGEAPDTDRKRLPATAVAVSDAQARAMLAAKVREAQAHNAAAYCADVKGSGMCERQWAEAGGDAAVPSQEPRVVRSVAHDHGIRALRTCGTLPDGTKYESDFVVRNNGGVPEIMLAVWWSGYPFSGAYLEGQEPKDTRTTSDLLCS